MSKLTQGLKMLTLLKSRGKLSRKELAELLGETPRNVVWLKEELEKAGYAIKSSAGRSGGYELLMNQNFPEIRFSDEDIDTLQLLHAYVCNSKELLHRERYMDLLDRLMAKYGGVSEEFFQVYNSVCLLRDRKELELIFEQIHQAIECHLCLQFMYEKPSGEVSQVLLKPYYLVAYRNGWYVKGLKNEEERTYKLNRMRVVQVSDTVFTRDETLCSSNMQSFDLEMVHLVLDINKNRNDISEYRYSENQVIEHIDSNTFRFSADMNEFAAWALIKNLGSDCRVIEPVYLKERLIDEARIILEREEEDEGLE